jgi:hypothetical protein
VPSRASRRTKVPHRSRGVPIQSQWLGAPHDCTGERSRPESSAGHHAAVLMKGPLHSPHSVSPGAPRPSFRNGIGRAAGP